MSMIAPNFRVKWIVLTNALSRSNERVTSLEDELRRSQKEIEELTAQIDVSCGTSTVHDLAESNPPVTTETDDDGGNASTSSTVASYSSTSGDSVDRGELLLKLSHLTQEVESLRAEKNRVAATTYSIPPSLLLHSPLMQSASFENATTGEPDPSTEKLKRSRRRLASLLHAKNKTVLACLCIRKWMRFALRRKEKGKLDALEQAHRHWAQVNVEERDRALLALDERVDDDHRSIQAAMNESRVSVGRSGHLEASPSPLRGTFMSNLSFEGTYGDPAPSSTSPMYGVRRWPVGYRAPSPRQSALDMPRDDEPQPRSLAVSEQETQTENEPPTADDAPLLRHEPTLIELENEELHVALSTSHGRENSLMAQLENALRDVEATRVSMSELQHQVADQDERILVTYIHLCANEIVHAESEARLSLEYNELRLRFHALQSLYPAMLLSAAYSRDHALTEWTRSDSRNHRSACLASDALSRGVSYARLRDYWDTWQRFTMVRRFESLSEMDRKHLAHTIEARDEANEKWMHKKILEERNSLEELHSREIGQLKLALDHANAKLSEVMDQSEIRVAQSKQIIRQLRNDAATGTLIASRLGGELVEYCASSAFNKWVAVIYRKRSERQMQQHRDSARWIMNLSGKQNITSARVTEDVVRITFAKWALLSTSTKEINDEAQRHLQSETQQLIESVRDRDALIDELQQRVASMHLETTEVLKPKIRELEQRVSDHEIHAQAQLRQELERLTEALQAAFQHEASVNESRHQQYCDELRESEALSTQELLEMQRTAHTEELRQLQIAHLQIEESNASRNATIVADILVEAYYISHAHFLDIVVGVASELSSELALVVQKFELVSKKLDALSVCSEMLINDFISLATCALNSENELLASVVSSTATFGHEIMRSATRVESTSIAAVEQSKTTVAMLWTIMEERDAVMRSSWCDFQDQLCSFRNVLFVTVSNELDELVQYGRFLEETTSSLENRLELQVTTAAKQQREYLNSVRDLEAHTSEVVTNSRITLASREEEIDRAHRNEVQRLNEELHEMRSRYLSVAQRWEDLSRTSLLATETLEERHRHSMSAIAEENDSLVTAIRQAHNETLAEVEKRCQSRIAKYQQELEFEMRASVKHQLRVQQDQSNLEFARYRNEVAETLQKLNSATLSLETQCREMIDNLEVSHRNDLVHLRSECSIRIREEVSLELEKRLDEVTSSQQRSLAAHQQNLSKALLDRQREHDHEIEVLKATYNERVATLERQIQENEEQHSVDTENMAKSIKEFERLSAYVSGLENGNTSLGEQLQRMVRNAALGCMSTEKRQRDALEECFASNHESLVQMKTFQCGQLLALQAEAKRMKSFEESRLQELTSQLVKESAIAVSEMQQEARRSSRLETRAVALKGLRLLRASAAHHAAHQLFSAWRRWTLIKGFRDDYKSLRTHCENTEEENSHLRHLIARALEERRAKVVDTASPVTIVSPLSDVPSVNHSSPSPTRIAEQMIGFSSHVNSSIERSGTTFAAVDAIVAQVDELIEKGKRLRASNRAEPKTESF
jgi:hypothetical protein